VKCLHYVYNLLIVRSNARALHQSIRFLKITKTLASGGSVPAPPAFPNQTRHAALPLPHLRRRRRRRAQWGPPPPLAPGPRRRGELLRSGFLTTSSARWLLPLFRVLFRAPAPGDCGLTVVVGRRWEIGESHSLAPSPCFF
jgi:hypothetical protein